MSGRWSRARGGEWACTMSMAHATRVMSATSTTEICKYRAEAGMRGQW